MTDRYHEGYEAAKRWYARRFNMRNGLLTDTAKAWQADGHGRARHAIHKTWPELAKQLDLIAVEAQEMSGEQR